MGKMKIFDKNGYVNRETLRKNGVSYYFLQKYLEDKKIIRVRRGLYRKLDIDETNEALTISGLFPDGILCMDTALFFYGYSDRTPSEWHIAVDKDSSKKRFEIQYPFVKPYYLEPKILEIGVSKEKINGVEMKIYDRDRTICECLRRMKEMDRETFNKALQAYILDPKKNVKNLISYSKKLRVYKKVRDLIGVWL